MSMLTMLIHIEFKHKVVKYPCNQCDYQGSKDALRMHLKLKRIVII